MPAKKKKDSKKTSKEALPKNPRRRKKIKVKPGIDPKKNPEKLAARARLIGRRMVVDLVDDLLSEENNLRKLRSSMQTSFDGNPLAFVQTVAVPLTPKSMLEDSNDSDGDKVDKIREGLRAMEDLMGG